MKLTREASSILGRSSIGMLALRAGRTARDAPLVNPAVFSFASGALWMTTSRYAAKTIIARRDPRAAFLVDGGGQSLLIRGALEVFDPLSISSQVRAMLDGPPFPAAQAARVPAVPAEVSRRLAGVSRGYACWIEGNMPVIRPAFWEVGRGDVSVAPASGHPRSGTPGAIVIESHHPFRPSLMVGACIRGTFGAAADADALADRYGMEARDLPSAIELRTERVTSWRGFAVTTAVPRSARRLSLAEA